MTIYQAQHRLVRPVNYCRGCGMELHHLSVLFCTKEDCQAIRTSWRHMRHNYKIKEWRSLHLDRDREINRRSHQRHSVKRNTKAKARYWSNPTVRQYYIDYSIQFHAKKRALSTA